MMLKETLRNIAKKQAEELPLFEKGIRRDDLDRIDPDIPLALVISGVRRCGKSTLLRQIMGKLKGCHYFNFEDPRVAGFDSSDFQKLDAVLREEQGEQKYYFFDEIQNAPKWELFVRMMLDKGKHFIITGSNASLLSRELGTRLTGRHLSHELSPFSFREFLALEKKKPGKKSFQEYLMRGGFPEYLKIGRAEVLQELLNDIITRDIALRHGIRNVKVLREMALYLVTNQGKEFSYNGLRKTFGLGSVNSAISFVSYFEDSYLLFTVPKFDYSLKKQLISPKKIYSVDNGLTNANSYSFSEDKGRLLENLAFLNLRKGNRDVFYFKGENECDFLVKEGTRIKEAVQVCYSLDEDNKDREINGLLEAMGKFSLKKGLVLTLDQEDEIKIRGKIILIKPLWEWLLE